MTEGEVRTIQEHHDRPRNTLLSQARRRLQSPSGSGLPMSRQELADAVNAYIWHEHNVEERLDAHDIGKLERGEHRWPGARRREAFRAVLHAETDAQLGFYITRRRSKRAVSDGWDSLGHGTTRLVATSAREVLRFPPQQDRQ